MVPRDFGPFQDQLVPFLLMTLDSQAYPNIPFPLKIEQYSPQVSKPITVSLHKTSHAT